MSDKILSVGLDLGTATTQLVLSELTIENIASVFTIPRVYITDKKVLYKSKIIFTPISHQSLIEVDKIKDFVIQEDHAKVSYGSGLDGAWRFAV